MVEWFLVCGRVRYFLAVSGIFLLALHLTCHLLFTFLSISISSHLLFLLCLHFLSLASTCLHWGTLLIGDAPLGGNSSGSSCPLVIRARTGLGHVWGVCGSWRILEPRDWKSTAIKNGKSWVGDPLENLMNIIFLCFHELRGGCRPHFLPFLGRGGHPHLYHYLGVPPLCSIYWFRGPPPIVFHFWFSMHMELIIYIIAIRLGRLLGQPRSRFRQKGFGFGFLGQKCGFWIFGFGIGNFWFWILVLEFYMYYSCVIVPTMHA